MSHWSQGLRGGANMCRRLFQERERVSRAKEQVRSLCITLIGDAGFTLKLIVCATSGRADFGRSQSLQNLIDCIGEGVNCCLNTL